jgi:D-sedoheptulose 7-phosphate isomerase
VNEKKFVDEYMDGIQKIVESLTRADVEKAIELLYEAWKTDKQVFVIGNGGSAATASHFACDLNKFTAVEGKKRFRAICLCDNAALLTALTNDLGWDNIYIEQLKNMMDDGDYLIVLSVHGGSGADKAGAWSQNLMKAAKYVQDRYGKVIGLSGFDGGLLKTAADVCIVVPFNSTPQVEGFHSVLAHLICAGLREKMEEK